MARMRLVKDAYEQIKADDPNTAVTLNGLRQLIHSGVIPTVSIGRKRLINYDALLDYLSSPPPPPEPADLIGVIRKIK